MTDSTLVRYTAEGEAITYDYDAIDSPDSELAEYEGRDWGIQFEDKDSLNGQTLTVVGMRPAADFGLGDTVAVRFRFDGDPGDQEPWGVLFTITSPIVQQLVGLFRKYPRTRIRAKFLKEASKTNKGYSYWKLDKPDPMNATPAENKKGSGK
jgi:hypothetical protein